MATNHNTAMFSSDLQTFIVTKYDPLLTIVKELNDKLQNSEKDKYRQIENEENLLAPWLFSCQLGTPLSSLQVLLEFSVQTTIELNVKLWKREEDMWVNFLETISTKSKNYLPETLNLLDLRKSTRKCLLNLCTNENLIVLRNVPGKAQAVYNTTTMTLVAILASAIYEAWKRIELTDPISLGRIVLVLDGEDVGSRLRAGNKKLKIEPLN